MEKNDFETTMLICKLIDYFNKDVNYNNIKIETVIRLMNYSTKINNIKWISSIWKLLHSLLEYPQMHEKMINYNIYEELIPILLLVCENLNNNVEVVSSNEILKNCVQFIKESANRSIYIN